MIVRLYCPLIMNIVYKIKKYFPKSPIPKPSINNNYFDVYETNNCNNQ